MYQGAIIIVQYAHTEAYRNIGRNVKNLQFDCWRTLRIWELFPCVCTIHVSGTVPAYHMYTLAWEPYNCR